MENKLHLFEIFFYFLKLGATGFGGPVALVLSMQKDLVEKRRWITPEHFQNILPLLKSMPGAFAFQTAAYLGRHRGGRLGGFLAGFALVLPAFVIMLILSVFVSEFKKNYLLSMIIEGFQWGAISIMCTALFSLIQGYERSPKFWSLVSLAAVLFYAGVQLEPLIIISSGIISMLATQVKSINKLNGKFIWTENLIQLSQISNFHSYLSFELSPIFHFTVVCLGAGAFVFGTGLAIAPMLEGAFVQHYQWLSRDDFMTALAFGQLTPGPVLVTVTMIGYKVFGITGAVLGTICIFLPGLIHMLTWFPSAARKLMDAKWVGPFLMGALAAVVFSILHALFRIFESSSHQKMGLLLVIVLIFFGKKKKWPSWSLVLFGGFMFGGIAWIAPSWL